MKRTLLILIALCFFTLPSGPVMAEWEIAASVIKYNKAEGKALVKIDLTADASSTNFDLFSYLNGDDKKLVNGLYSYRLKTVPIGTLSGQYTVTLTDAMESATIADRSTTTAQLVKVASYTESGGYLSIYGGLTVGLTSPGEGEQLTLYLESVR
ncbi:hypothetical protein DSCW_18000 [Desulfosarcina widdelii]|uniref:Uncharacterized protein n=1 Tax=Desulfosarcina widdelii TaxID=947919 RepID=A0A5K7Z2T3_9BACT|nr:hypothetical protein [Desulfosarcina widdelii]BBO74383.1 hypothetical protein DSCW_18000 [Desulfosarcina widdelii]